MFILNTGVRDRRHFASRASPHCLPWCHHQTITLAPESKLNTAVCMGGFLWRPHLPDTYLVTSLVWWWHWLKAHETTEGGWTQNYSAGTYSANWLPHIFLWKYLVLSCFEANDIKRKYENPMWIWPMVAKIFKDKWLHRISASTVKQNPNTCMYTLYSVTGV